MAAYPNVFQNTGFPNPAATGGTSLLMSGGGISGGFTPRGSGIVRVSITGNVSGSVASSGGVLQLVYGTGLAPAALASLTGTPIGRPLTYTAPASAGAVVPFAMEAIIYNLNPNVGYWFDLAYSGNGTGSTGPTSIQILAMEL